MNTLTVNEKRILLVITGLSFLVVAVMSFSAPQKARAATVCSPATAITSPSMKDGIGDVCLQATTLCTYINSWNLTTLEVNGIAYTNLYVAADSIAPLNGGYTIHYSSTASYGHFEIGGSCTSATSTATVTPTTTPAGATATVTRTVAPASATATATRTITPATGCSTATSPYTKDGIGDVCLQVTTLCTYINSWNLTTLEVNGTAYTNQYVAASLITPLNGGYTIHYSSTVSSGHFEIGGSCTSATSTVTPTGSTPLPAPAGVVNAYGRLQISGAALRDKNGNAIQLVGTSSHGLTWFPLSDLNLNTTSNINILNQQITFNPAGGVPFPYTSSAVGNLATQWHIQVIRASMFTYDPWNGADAKSYDNNYPAWKWYNINLVNTIVQSAINQNIYVIIDWHAGEGNDPDPNVYWNNGHAQEFFTYMVNKWGSYPNVIYETVNSPVIGWTAGLKTYNQNVIDLIRAREIANGYAPNLILAGTPTWSQDVDVATASPLTGNLIAYNYMWYAGTHFSWVQSRGDTALANLAANAPNQTVFMGEVGTSAADGNGGVYYSNFNTLMEWAKTRKLSWLTWSLASKEESSATFVRSIAGNMINNEIAWRGGNGMIAEALASTGYPMRMGPWANADYSCSGKFVMGWILYDTSQATPSGC